MKFRMVTENGPLVMRGTKEELEIFAKLALAATEAKEGTASDTRSNFVFVCEGR